MKAIAETNSLEGWTKVTDNALREWHDDIDNDSGTRPNIDRNIDNHSSRTNDDDKCDKIDEKEVIKNFQVLALIYNYVVFVTRK